MGILQDAAKRVLREDLDSFHNQQRQLSEAYGDLAFKHTQLENDLKGLQEVGTELRDRGDMLASENELLQETMSELSLYLEDKGWMRLSGLTEANMLKRSVIGSVADESRVLYLKNPIVQRGANVKRLYVWGQGMTVQAADPDINDVIQAFMDDRRNRIELTAHQARMLKEIDLQCDGNIFFVLFINPSNGYVRLASIPFSQMQEIICNPEDSKEPWYYLRSWTEIFSSLGTYNVASTVLRKAYYHDWHYLPATVNVKIEDVEVKEGLIYHVKVGSFSDWKWGMSEHLAAQDWAIAYKEFLEDWASIVRSYRRFAWRYSGAKTAAEIAAVKSKTATTIGSGIDETNPPPVTGAIAITREGRDLQPIRTAGATVAAEDGRRLLLMVAATEGLPETYFGDVSVGTLATATAMDRPTELMMADRQMLWADVHKEIFEFVLLQAVKATNGPLRGKGQYRKEKMNGQWEEWVEWNEDVDPTVDIDFPPLLESSVKESVEAIVHGATLGGLPQAGTIPQRDVSRLILQALGADDIDATLDELYPEDGEPIEYNPEEVEPEESLKAAARQFRDGLDGLLEKYAGATP